MGFPPEVAEAINTLMEFEHAEWNAMLDFEARLERKAVERLAGLCEEDIRLLLTEVEAMTPIKVVDFGDRGIALVGEAFDTLLRPAYEAIYDASIALYGSYDADIPEA
jgi:hypothetical protein